MARFGASSFITGGLLIVSSSIAVASPIPLDLNTWSVVQYDFTLSDNGAANWVIENNGTTARQTENALASILLGDFDFVDAQIEGTWRLDDDYDDDFMGFVFGFQNPGQFYLFDWKQNDQLSTEGGGFASQGMNLRLIDAGPDGTPGTTDLWATGADAGPYVEFLRQNNLPYSDFVDYTFRLNFQPGQFEITILEGNTILENWLVEDDTYTSGQFGFYNLSQNDVLYSGFMLDNDPPAIGEVPVPVPASFALMTVGLLGLWQTRRGARAG